MSPSKSSSSEDAESDSFESSLPFSETGVLAVFFFGVINRCFLAIDKAFLGVEGVWGTLPRRGFLVMGVVGVANEAEEGVWSSFDDSLRFKTFDKHLAAS